MLQLSFAWLFLYSTRLVACNIILRRKEMKKYKLLDEISGSYREFQNFSQSTVHRQTSTVSTTCRRSVLCEKSKRHYPQHVSTTVFLRFALLKCCVFLERKKDTSGGGCNKNFFFFLFFLFNYKKENMLQKIFR